MKGSFTYKLGEKCRAGTVILKITLKIPLTADGSEIGARCDW